MTMTHLGLQYIGTLTAASQVCCYFDYFAICCILILFISWWKISWKTPRKSQEKPFCSNGLHTILPSQETGHTPRRFIIEAAVSVFLQSHSHFTNITPLHDDAWYLSQGCVLPHSGRGGKYTGRKGSNVRHCTDLSSIPFINITCYKKNKIFSVNELSNNITSVDYRWYGMLIPRVVAVGLKTSNTVDLAFSFHSQGHSLPSFWSCSTDLTTICPCNSIVIVT